MPAPSSNPFCPRCGYDLQGFTSTWKESCPLDGVCSECGLEFEWRNVVNPRLRVPGWFVEHSFNRLWRTLFPTYVRALAPLRFWRTVQLWFPIMPGKLAQFAAAGLAIFHVLLAYMTVAQDEGWWWPLDVLSAPDGDWLTQIAWTAVWPYSESVIFDAGWTIILLGAVLTPMQFFLLRRSMKAAMVRSAHLGRIGVYSLSLVLPLMAVTILVSAFFHWNIGGYGSITDQVLRWVTNAMESIAPIPVWLLVVAAAWYFVFWYAATKWYLQLKHAAGVAAAMLTIGTILAVLLTMLLDFDGFVEFIRFQSYWY